MKLKNVSTRAYGIMGKIYAPLQTFELTDEVAIASIQPAIDAGDIVVVESKKQIDDNKFVEDKSKRKFKLEANTNA